MELRIYSAEAGPGAQPGTLTMLTRADFDAAVKDALRHYTRADLLIGSPLLETRIATACGEAGERGETAARAGRSGGDHIRR